MAQTTKLLLQKSRTSSLATRSQRSPLRKSVQNPQNSKFSSLPSKYWAQNHHNSTLHHQTRLWSVLDLLRTPKKTSRLYQDLQKTPRSQKTLCWSPTFKVPAFSRPLICSRKGLNIIEAYSVNKPMKNTSNLRKPVKNTSKSTKICENSIWRQSPLSIICFKLKL